MWRQLQVVLQALDVVVRRGDKPLRGAARIAKVLNNRVARCPHPIIATRTPGDRACRGNAPHAPPPQTRLVRT